MHRELEPQIPAASAGNENATRPEVVILGGGIAGLSVGYHLSQSKYGSFRIYEAQDQVGGLARSFNWHDADCDIAPHRLFSQNKALLKTLLSLVECNKIPRRSKIVLDGKWINDPISILELLRVNFPFRSLRLMMSYLTARLSIKRPFGNFDDFAKASYGHELNELFFKPYAEKLLGLESRQIAAAWGKRKLRVSGFRDIIRKNTKLYFKYFYYPKAGGYGAFARALGKPIKHNIETQHSLEKIVYRASEKIYECQFRNRQGDTVTTRSPALVSTLPLSTLLNLLGHSIEFHYRKLRLVYLHVNRDRVMDEQWVYFIDKSNIINRVSEFKNFYPRQSQTKKRSTILCAEITSDPDCSASAVVEELQRMKIIKAVDVLDTKRIDIANAYPIYDTHYERKLAEANEILKQYPDLFLLGRQAEFSHQDIDEIFDSAQQMAARYLKVLAQ
ncbi:MAG: NAD(P)-binding protein [Arenicella sp.]|nr:NAD(P)-binding protein [Arenicella sp.]